MWREKIGSGARIYESVNASTGEFGAEKFHYVNYDVQIPVLGRDQRLVLFTNLNVPGPTLFEVYEFSKTKQLSSVPDPKPLYEGFSDFKYRQIYLSPDSRCMAAIYTDPDEVNPTVYGLVVLDFQNQADVIKLTPVKIQSISLQKRKLIGFDWLPNGEYIYAYSDGELVRGSCTNRAQAIKTVGRIRPPTTYDLIGGGRPTFSISPDGTKILVTLVGDAILKDEITKPNVSDVWVTDITGGNMQRVTVGDKTGLPMWSPDGKYIVLGYESYKPLTGPNLSPSNPTPPVLVLVGNRGDVPTSGYWAVPYVPSSFGTWWYVPADARNVSYPKNLGEVGIRLNKRYTLSSVILNMDTWDEIQWTK
jgi:hypothetical protein